MLSIFVMLLLATLLFIFNALNHHLLSKRTLYQDELHYWQSYHYSASALEWGSSQIWMILLPRWQCRVVPLERTKVCLKLLIKDQLALLKSRSVGSDKRELVTLYHYVKLQPLYLIPGEPSSIYSLSRLKGGWIDYCPLRKGNCE